MTDRENFASFLMRMRKKGGVDQNVLDAFEATPRRGFVPEPMAGRGLFRPLRAD